MKCFGSNLEKILPFMGLNLENSKQYKDSKLILHTGDISSIKVTNAKIIKRIKLSEIESYLKQHIPKCEYCAMRYFNFLKEKSNKNSIKKIDKEYLGLLE